eukprot:s3895_g10.t1
MISWTSSVLQDFRGEVGQSCVLTHLDLDGLGESFGPSQQPLLRKRFNPEIGKEKEAILGKDRIVSVTEAAAGRSKETLDIAAESVFSGPALPEAFYKSFLKANSVTAVCLGLIS